MDIQITAKNFAVTPALKDYAEKKIAGIQKYFENIIKTELVFSLEKYRQIADITIFANGITIHARESTIDMYSSVDKVISKVDRQIKRYKEKIKRHRYHDNNVPVPHNIIEKQRLKDDYNVPKIIETKSFVVKPMNLDEAVMQMDLTGYTFLVFRNSDTDKVNVIYQRKDGNLGLIEP